MNKSLIRVGRHEKCDLQLTPSVNPHMIGKVHMLLYTTWNSDGTVTVFARDNKTKFGTYVLNSSGVQRCPGLTTLVDHSHHMRHGDKLLICRGFSEAAPYEIAYQLKMPDTGPRGAGRGLVPPTPDASSVSHHVRAIPQLVESPSFWWDDEGDAASKRGSSAMPGRSAVASRIARLRRAAAGPDTVSRQAARVQRDAVSLPSLRGASTRPPGAGGFASSDVSISSTLASSSLDGYGSLGSISTMSSASVSLSGSSSVAGAVSLTSAKSAPVKKSRYMISGHGGSDSSAAGEKGRRRREVNGKYSKLANARARGLPKGFLTVVDGQVVVGKTS